MKSKSLLVTGGAGYIGSHVVLDLLEAGYEVAVVDDLSTGVAAAVPRECRFAPGDMGDKALLASLLEERQIAAVLHFAASTSVDVSVANPLLYYDNNTSKSRVLMEACVEAGVRHFVFSSTAAVYGAPEVELIATETPAAPINPYGASKLMTEWMLRDLAAVSPMRYAALRYFNVAGAAPDGRAGQSTPACKLLIKVACEAALGKRERLCIFGTDYPTPDGTAIRDYIHISDLSAAHLLALRHLEEGGESVVLNCGYGRGYSVREVARMVEKVHGRPFPIVEAGRRPGDPPRLVADGSSAREILGWRPRYDDLEYIVSTSYRWERAPRY